MKLKIGDKVQISMKGYTDKQNIAIYQGKIRKTKSTKWANKYGGLCCVTFLSDNIKMFILISHIVKVIK